ncbi:hypothetical protein [Streptomyces sp. NPDC048349]|uniref:hypothetical protein n=1 Tax=Streptomyces sp. NPDC048349 TaxID=3155486 RepID=UPI003414E2A4
MPANNYAEIVVPVVTACSTAAIGAAGLMFKDYRRKRDFEHRYRIRLEKAGLEVQFITNWIQARQLLEPGTARTQEAEEWLQRCYQVAEKAGEETPEKLQRPTLRRLLLLQPLAGPAANTTRAVYWVSFAWLNLLVLAWARKIAQWLAPGGSSVGGDVVLALFVVALFAFLAAGIRKLSLNLDAAARRGSISYPTTWRVEQSGRGQQWLRVTGIVFVVLLVVWLLAATILAMIYESS